MSLKVSNVSSAFLYVEPNFKEVGETGYYDLKPVTLDDLSVFIELHVETIDNKSNKYHKSTGENFIFKAKIPRNNNQTEVSLQRGNANLKFKDIKNSQYDAEFLTTEAYDKYTINEINSTDTHELFGIKSIDIAYNNYMVPEVTIQFTDIKGAALMGAEEYGRDNNGKFDTNKDVLVGQFFKCFFTIPYPRFHLYVKGYYGMPVHYDLMCANFHTTFDSSTGNYEATARMVGYSYALISDVSMSSLIASPLSTYYGNQYWNDRINDGSFMIDNQPFPTLLDVYVQWQDKMGKLSQFAESEEGKIELGNKQQIYTNYIDAINRLEEIIVLLKNEDNFTSNDDIYKVLHDSSGVLFFMVRGHNPSLSFLTDICDTINEKYDSLYTLTNNSKWIKQKINKNDVKSFLKINCISNDITEYQALIELGEDGELENTQGLVDFLTTNYNKILTEKDLTNFSYDIRVALNNEFEKLKDKDITEYQDLLYYAIIDYRNDFKELTEKKIEYGSYLNEQESYQQKKVNEELEKLFGFKFTIKNISKILFAHLETFLSMYERVKNDVQNGHRKNIAGGASYVFPEVLQIINQGNEGNKSLEEKWIGDVISNNEPEAQMVECLLSGLHNEITKHNVSVGSKQEKPWKRVCVQDLFLASNPFSGVKKLTKSFVCNRSAFVLGLNIHNQEFNPQKAGELDAENYYNANPIGYDNLLHDVNSSYFINPLRDNSNYGFIQDCIYSYWHDPGELLCNKIGVKTIVHQGDKLNFQIIHNVEDYDSAIIHLNGEERSVSVSNGWLSDYFSNSFENYLSTSQVKFRKINNEEDVLFSINKEMTQDDYVLVQFPQLRFEDAALGGIAYAEDYFFFSNRRYKNLTDKRHKAVLFLLLFFQFKEEWINFKGAHAEQDFKAKIINFFANNSNLYTSMEAVPYFWVLLIGGLYYWQATSPTMEINNYRACLSTDFNLEIFKYLKKDLIDLFSDEFYAWCDKYYNKWDDEFSQIENQNVIITEVINNKTEYYLNINNKCVKELSEQFFKIVYVVKSSPYCVTDNEVVLTDARTIWNEYCDNKIFEKNTLIIPKEWVETYLLSFNEKLKELFHNVMYDEAEKNILIRGNINTDLRISTYNYLKQIWDRWLVYDTNFMENWNMKEIFEGNGRLMPRIHFIDAYYNHVGDNIPINLSKFVTLIHNVIQNQNYPFLSFLSYLYQDNNCVLYNIQNFLGIQNQQTINSIFTAIPTLQITKPKQYSDLIILHHFKPANDVEDGFNISEQESFLPAPIRFKNQNGGMKIPSFGVVYGMQNQNYFTDISVSTTKPAATEQSIQAMLQIAAANSKGSDNNAQVISIGQDMYTVYAQQSYECTVTMMGCALIQPLMYFQLLNVPLFRGAYIIQKVTHSISPNHMVTKFVGTRLSKISSKIVEETFFYSQKKISVMENDLEEKKYANVTNNCPYAYFSPKSISSTTEGDSEITIDTFIAAIEKTCKETVACKTQKIEKEKIDDNSYLLRSQGNNNKENALLFDIILQTYSDTLLQNVSWIVDGENNGNDYPSKIYIQFYQSGDFKVNVSYLNNKKPTVINTYKGLNQNFYISLLKRYGISKNNIADKNFKVACTNFTSLCNVSNWEEQVKNFFFKQNALTSGTTIIECDSVVNNDKQRQTVINNHDVPIGYSFEGDNTCGTLNYMNQAVEIVKAEKSNAANNLGKRARSNVEENQNLISKYVNYVKSNVKTNPKDPNYQCAKYVRIALEQIGINTSTRPNSACRYYEHLIYWGFEEVYYGLLSAYKGGYQNGDIVVTAGLKQKSVHGHIQIYCDGKWYSDRVYNNPCVYTPERVSYLFRLPTV